LNDNYKQAKVRCDDALDQKRCSQSLLAAQRSWLAFRDGFSNTFIEAGGGQIAPVFSLEFLYTATKAQALALDGLANMP
jgi:uncharacterized protein YecT (DUF1311 family)